LRTLKPLLLPAILLLIAATCQAADKWTEYRSGPFRVISDARDKPAREALATLEQVRFVLGNFLGSKNGLGTVWPIELILFSNQKEYGPHALPQTFVPGGSAMLAAWTGDAPLPHPFLRDVAELLIQDNAGPLPEKIETALTDLFSTIQVSGTKVTLGAPPGAGELPEPRMRAWARIQLLATNPDYTGKLRVYLNNLQQSGDEDAAVKNAFDLSRTDFDKRVDAYYKAGQFQSITFGGAALAPNRDFIEKPVPDTSLIMQELKLAGKEFVAGTPRAMAARGTPESLQAAVKANPKWAEPHAKLAALENNPQTKIAELKQATSLQPRNFEYWLALAHAQEAAEQFDDAAKSWARAEIAAPNEDERSRIHVARTEESEKRAEYDIELKKRLAALRAADLERIKKDAADEVHAAEAAANARLGGLKQGEKPVAWWTQEQGEYVTGTLTRIECLSGSMRFTIQTASNATLRLAVEDPKQLTVRDGTAEFACGVQRPTRKIGVVHDGKPNAKLSTTGNVKVVEFPK
jgi:hypothetical protein